MTVGEEVTSHYYVYTETARHDIERQATAYALNTGQASWVHAHEKPSECNGLCYVTAAR